MRDTTNKVPTDLKAVRGIKDLGETTAIGPPILVILTDIGIKIILIEDIENKEAEIQGIKITHPVESQEIDIQEEKNLRR